MIRKNFHSLFCTVVVRVGYVKCLDKHIVSFSNDDKRAQSAATAKSAVAGKQDDDSEDGSAEDEPEPRAPHEQSEFDFDRDCLETLRALLICVNDAKILMLLENMSTYTLLNDPCEY